jgi:DNA polymerase III delta subunit
MNIAELNGLRETLKKKGYVPAVLVCSSDEGVREQVVSVVQEGLANAPSPVTIKRVNPDKDDAYGMLDALAKTGNLFGEGVVLVITKCAGPVVPKELKDFLNSPSRYLTVVLFGDSRMRQSELASAIKASGVVMVAEDLKSDPALRWVQGVAQELGVEIGHWSATLLVDLVGRDRGAIARALEAIANYKGEGYILEDDIYAYVSRTRDIPPWEFEDAVLARDIRKALRAGLRRLHFHPNDNMVERLVSSVRKILWTKGMVQRGCGKDEIMKELQINYDFQVENLLRKHELYTMDELESFLKKAKDFEILWKRANSSPETILTLLVCELLLKKQSVHLKTSR